MEQYFSQTFQVFLVIIHVVTLRKLRICIVTLYIVQPLKNTYTIYIYLYVLKYKEYSFP